MRNQHLLRNWLILIGIVLSFVFVVKAYLAHLSSPVDSSSKTQAFVVQKGESVNSIAQRLQEQKIIRSAMVFKWELKASGKAGEIQAGDFKLSGAMSVDEVIKVLNSGSLDKWITLLEGWRVEEMAQKLNSELGIKNEDFVKEAKRYEGHLFPDTYLFNPDATAETIVATLRNNFDKKYDEGLQSQIQALGLSSDQGVILASIVEREGRSDKVRQMVASILLKRLKIGMGLNTDATIQYALGYQADEKSWWKRSLTKDDLKVDSPFNTYLYKGLPPKPICNPSLSSLKAVASADPQTPYLYYYHDSQGNSYYAKTLDEHNDNVANHP